MSSVDWKTIHEYEDIRFEQSGDLSLIHISQPTRLLSMA